MTVNVNVSIKRDIGRLIAHGLPAKLTFDQSCMRTASFDEGYVGGIINEIVGSNLSDSDFWIRRGYAHAALQDQYALKKKLGRSRELDFFITPSKGRAGPSLAMEVKWTPSTHCSWREVVCDFYRLKLVASAYPDTDCMFVLGGLKNEVQALVEMLRKQSQKRAVGAHYSPPLVLRSNGSKSGISHLSPYDHGGRFFGGDKVRKKLPLRSNGKHFVPTGIRLQLLGESSVGSKEWMAAVWRLR